jgi:hypothetical protein
MAKDADRGYATDDQIAAAREILRSGAQASEFLEPVSTSELIDELGDRFLTTPAMWRLLSLIEKLWDDSHIDRDDP